MKSWAALLATGIVCAGAGFLAGRAGQPGHARAPVAHEAGPSGIAVTPSREAPAPPPAPVAQSGARALNLLRTTLDTHGPAAQACLVFSAPLATGGEPADFVRIAPEVRTAMQVSGERLCVGGLAYGVSYQLTVKAGLRGADGSSVLADEVLPLSLGDLPQSLDFADDGFILPRDIGGGLPIATVNAARVHLRVDRITDRVLVRTQLGASYSDNEGDEDTLGVPLWEGDLAVKGGRNERVVTGFPLAQVMGTRLPGAYRITIVPPEHTVRPDDGDTVQPRWLFDTDLMLSSHRGADGLHVFVRSLSGARPVPGTVVTLIAANNDELGHGTADSDGAVAFPPGLLRGEHGHVPRMVMAYRGDDFTALQLDKPGFDFSDRGVDGRPDPGPVDGFLYTDRGIYRPGEQIDLTTIVRGALSEPLPAGQAVTIVLRRPDGVESAHWRVVPNAVGAAVQVIPLKPTSPRGTWRLEEMLAGTKDVVGRLELQVQDFVPNRLAVELTPDRPRVAANAPASIAVDSRYLYGAPAANLQVTAHLQLQPDRAPVPEQGWQFGRTDETLNTEAQDIDGQPTDAHGHSAIVVDAGQLKLPQTSLPLRADITVSVAEPGGKATESQTSLKLSTHDVLLGLRPPVGDTEGAMSVAAAAFAPDGSRLARRVAFRLFEQITDYHYFRQGDAWQWKVSTHDRPVSFGSIDVPAAEGGAPIGLPKLDWGTYRLEVSDEEAGAFTSILLQGGGQPADTGDSPERVAVSLVGPPPHAGGDAHLHIRAPFAGQMLVTVENSRVLAVQTATIGEGGADITVHATQDWGAGAYVMASVYRPAGEARGHAPVRAIGLAYVGLDATDRTIGVALTAAPVLRPRGHLDLGVAVSGKAAAGPVWLTVAAVDEGILQLTRFANPDPEAHFFGKRRLAVDVRDDYAHLIDGSAASPGEIRAGGDMDGAGLSVVPTRTTALFSGLVQVGADGHAVVPIDLPDFTGGLRLMAVAVSQAGFGHADQAVAVRDPVVAQISLPRFLAPHDDARMTLLAHNVEAPAGTFHVHIEAEGALAMTPVDADIALAPQQAVVETYPLSGGALGVGRVVLTLTGPDGMRIVHDWPMEVRTAFESVTLATRADQPPGATVMLSPTLARGLAPGATLRASFSAVGNIDLPGLLASLDEYPFGCSEQLVSRAMPLLYVADAATATLGVAPGDLRLRVQDAVDKLLERQDDGGAFGLWRAGDGQSEPYLGAEILDFLGRARTHGYAVPEAALTRAAKALAEMEPDQWMLRRYWYDARDSEKAYRDQDIIDAGRAYALLLAARAGQASLGDLRYMHDESLDKLEPLSQAQLAVALGIAGDQARAAHAFDAAERNVATERDDLAWRLADFYRTRLRDTAAMVSLAAELGDRARVLRLLAALDRMDTTPDRLTTQEKGWLVVAAGTLLEGAGPVSIAVAGVAQPAQAVVVVRRDIAALGDGLSVRNTGRGVISRVVAVRGLPLRAPPASAATLSVRKAITGMDGKPVDPDHLQQNTRLVVHLSGSVADSAYHQTMLVDPSAGGLRDRAGGAGLHQGRGQRPAVPGRHHRDQAGREARRPLHGGDRFRPRGGGRFRPRGGGRQRRTGRRRQQRGRYRQGRGVRPDVQPGLCGARGLARPLRPAGRQHTRHVPAGRAGQGCGGPGHDRREIAARDPRRA